MTMYKNAQAALSMAYREGPICLFTGAGVSFTEAKYYRTPGWWDLLLETYGAIHPSLRDDESRARFEELRTQHRDPWDMADVLVREAGSEDAFLEAMRRILVGRTGRDMKYKRLPMAYLKGATTLNAVIAFCSRLRALRVYPCLMPNPKVRAVLTLNYDWFLEGGATQKYNADRFKPMVSQYSTEDPKKLPIYHLHRYLPHDVSQKPKYRPVLTKDSYEKAYATGTFTVTTLDKFLGSYPTLFIGISFGDKLLIERLTSLARLESTPDHFALLREGELELGLLHQIEEARIRPIFFSSFEEIPEILGQLYRSGLSDDDLAVPLESKSGGRLGLKKLSAKEYWELLLFNKP